MWCNQLSEQGPEDEQNLVHHDTTVPACLSLHSPVRTESSLSGTAERGGNLELAVPTGTDWLERKWIGCEPGLGRNDIRETQFIL